MSDIGLFVGDRYYRSQFANGLSSYLVFQQDGITYADPLFPGGTVFSGSTAIQDALNNGLDVMVKGSPSYSATLTLNANNRLRGLGKQVTFLNYTGSGIAISATSVRNQVRDLTLSTSTGTVGLDLSGVFDSQYDSLRTAGFSTAGLKLRGNAGNAAIFNQFDNCEFEDPARLAMDDVTNTANSNEFNTCRFTGSCQLGNSSFNPTGTVFNNCGFNPSSGTGFVNYGNGTVLIGCDSELAGSTTTIDNESSLGRITLIGGYYSNVNNTGLYGMGFVNNGQSFELINVRQTTDIAGLTASLYARGIVTAGLGYAPIYKSYSTIGNSALVTNAINYTPPAIAGTYRISAFVNVRTAAAVNMSVTIAYKDAAGNARSETMPLNQQASTNLVVNMNNVAARFTGNYIFQIDNSATPITLSTTGTTMTLYDLAASLQQIA